MEGTVTTAPHIPPRPSPDQYTNHGQVEAIVDTKLRQFAAEIEQRISGAERRANLRQRALTYGVGGVAGLAVGIGGTLIVQRLRRGRGPATTMKP